MFLYGTSKIKLSFIWKPGKKVDKWINQGGVKYLFQIWSQTCVWTFRFDLENVATSEMCMLCIQPNVCCAYNQMFKCQLTVQAMNVKIWIFIEVHWILRILHETAIYNYIFRLLRCDCFHCMIYLHCNVYEKELWYALILSIIWR